MVRRSSSSCWVTSELVPSWSWGGRIGCTVGFGIFEVGGAVGDDVRSMHCRWAGGRLSFPSWLCGLDDVGEGVVESVGGVVSGSDGADWDVGAPR